MKSVSVSVGNTGVASLHDHVLARRLVCGLFGLLHLEFSILSLWAKRLCLFAKRLSHCALSHVIHVTYTLQQFQSELIDAHGHLVTLTVYSSDEETFGWI